MNEELLAKIPAYMHAGLKRYIDHGIPPGHFLTAVLTNDLRGAFERADEANSAAVRDYIVYLYNCAPIGSWGSPEAYARWVKRGGFNGVDLVSDEDHGDHRPVQVKFLNSAGRRP